VGSKSRYFLILKIMPLLTLCVCSAGSLKSMKKVVISVVVDTSIKNAFICDVTPSSLLQADCREFTHLSLKESHLTTVLVLLFYCFFVVIFVVIVVVVVVVVCCLLNFVRLGSG
jgi:hypothetical protein